MPKKKHTYRVTYRSDEASLRLDPSDDRECAIKAFNEDHARELFADGQRSYDGEWEIVKIERWRPEFAHGLART